MKLRLFPLFLCFAVPVFAQEDPQLLVPSFHAYGVVGSSSADSPGEFAPGGHDPNRDGAFQVQALEPSLSLHWQDHVRGFVTGLAFTDQNDDFEWEWEEYFLSLHSLPGGFELRGGLMLNRVGFHNAQHLHSWTTVDAPLVNSLFLGEDGLATKAAELNWYSQGDNPLVLSLSFGQRPDHSHDHGHGGEDEHGHEDEDHDDEEHEGEEHEEHGDEHGHEHGEGFEALEEFRVQDDVWTLGLRKDLAVDDFNRWTFAGFGGGGDNETGESSWFAGVGVEYTWRENGLEPGGRAVRWRTEIIHMDGKAGAHDDDHEEEHEEEEHEEEHEEHGDDDHHEEGSTSISGIGFSSEVKVEATDLVHPFLRFDYVDSIDELEASDWFRTSIGTALKVYEGVELKLQANFDERGDESEQSFWAQIGFAWGGPEVR